MAVKPKINIFPDEDKSWGGYTGAVQCLHCRRWMVIDFERTYISESGCRHHIVAFKELRYERGNWYISSCSHSPNICKLAKENREWARKEGFKSYGAFKRYVNRMKSQPA